MMKLVRLSLNFRSALITNPAASLSIVGYLSPSSVVKTREDDDDTLSKMCDRIKAARDRLVRSGVWERSIAGYLPLSGAPIREDVIVLTAQDKPIANLFPGTTPVPLGDDSIDPDDDARSQAQIVINPLAAPVPPSNKQVVLGYTLIPKPIQGATGPIDPLNPLKTLHQFSVTITRAYHPKNKGGLEFSPLQATVNLDDKFKVSSVGQGVQLALVQPLVSGWIQVSGFAQVMGGLNWNKTITGQAKIVAVAQGALGGQILVTPQFKGGGFYKFLREHVQIGIQGTGALNVPGVGSANFGAQGAIILNIPFDIM